MYYVILVILIMIIVYSIIFTLDLFDSSNNNEQYRIVERRSSGCDHIEYIPEKLGKFSREYHAINSEYFIGRRLPKGYDTLSKAKNAIKEYIEYQREEIEANKKYPAYEKIHKV